MRDNLFSKGRMGLVYPWAKRAKFVREIKVLYDFYDYGPDHNPLDRG